MVVISHNILYVVFSCAFKHNHPILSGSKTLISNSGQSPNIYNTPRLANFYHSMNSVTKVFHLLLGIFSSQKQAEKMYFQYQQRLCKRPGSKHRDTVAILEKAFGTHFLRRLDQERIWS